MVILRRILLIFSILLVIILAACDGGGEEATTVAPIEGDSRLTPASDETEAPRSAAQEQASTSYPEPAGDQGLQNPAYPAPTLDALLNPYPSPDSNPGSTDTTPVTKPPVRSELQATDPKTVQLASGKIQLVEFFAFW